MPEKETEGTFSGRFFDPFFNRPLSENSFKAKNPSLLAKFGQKGGCAIPARAVFWGFLEKKPKKRPFFLLSLYGEANKAKLGVAVAERVSAVREGLLSYKFKRG